MHVVRPEWVTDSIDAGKRLSEKDYAVIKVTNSLKITDMFGYDMVLPMNTGAEAVETALKLTIAQEGSRPDLVKLILEIQHILDPLQS